MRIVRRPLNRDCRGIYVDAEVRMLQSSIKNCTAIDTGGGFGMWTGTSALLATDSVRGRRSNISAWSLTAQIAPHSPRGVAHPSQTIEDCAALTFGSTSYSGYAGGGTLQGSGVRAKLINCSILRCQSQDFAGGLEVSYALLEMVGGIVASCRSGVEGGGLAVTDARLVLDDVLVSDCESRSQTPNPISAGGGIFVRGSGILEMTGGAIRDCRAPTAYGGGIRCEGTSEVKLSGVKVQRCTAFKGAAISIEKSSGDGAAFVSLVDVDIEDCVSDNNVIISHSQLVAKRVRVVGFGPGRAVSLFVGSSGTWTDCSFSDGTWAGQSNPYGAAIQVLAGTHTFNRTAVLRSSGYEAGPNPYPHTLSLCSPYLPLPYASTPNPNP